MSTETMPPDVKIILRNIDPPQSAREYALNQSQKSFNPRSLTG
jgi:hypothetical protein